MLEDIRSISAAMPEPGADAAATAATHGATVSRDMERIFGPVGRRPAQVRPADPIRPISAEHSASWRKWAMAAVLVALPALLIAGGAAWMAQAPQPRATKALPGAIEPKPPLPRDLSTPAIVKAPAMVNPVASAQPVAAAPPPKAKAVPRRAVRKTARADGAARCSRLGGSARARCMRPYVLAADRQLRTAYARATRAGVGARTLSAYRKRWAQMRGRANTNPVTVTAAYRQMARQLDAARRRR